MRALWRAFGTSRLARTVCAAPTGAANHGPLRQDARRHLRGLRARAADRPVGREPRRRPASTSFPSSRKRGRPARKLVVVDPRATSLAEAGGPAHLALRPGTDVAVALALHKYLFDQRTRGPATFLAEHTHGVDELRARADEWPIERAAERRRRRRRRARAVRRALCGQRRRRSSDAGGGSSATATAAAPSPRCSRCPPSPASSACAAAASR